MPHDVSLVRKFQLEGRRSFGLVIRIKARSAKSNYRTEHVNYHTAGWHFIRTLHLQSEKPNLKINEAPSGVHCNESLCSTLQYDFML